LDLNQAGWLFSGRTEELQHVISWLNEGATDLLVVTGAPGVGKSSLLGFVLSACRAETRFILELVPQGRLNQDVLSRTSNSRIDAFVHLTNQSLGSAAADVARSTEMGGLGLGCDGSDIEELVEEIEALARDGVERVILFDALDESSSPVQIGRSVIARIAALDGFRVIVGTRKSSEEKYSNYVEQTQPDGADRADLLEAVGIFEATAATAGSPAVVDRRTVLRLTHDRDTDLRAVEEFVRWRMLEWAQGHPKTLELLADEIAGTARPFLYATLACAEIERSFDAIDVINPLDIADETNAPLVLAQDVEELLRHSPIDFLKIVYERRRWLRGGDRHATGPALMRSLAYARGRGFPADGQLRFGHIVWWTAAKAIDDKLEMLEARRCEAPGRVAGSDEWLDAVDVLVGSWLSTLEQVR